MKRDVDLHEISDGRFYGLNDMVKADCHGCEGCSACCHQMGNSIQLDPYDIHCLMIATGESFEQLMKERIELSVVDGLILPNLKMSETTGACSFLNHDGRCSIHKYRPGICRIFPLGRVYQNHTFSYILQTKECKMEHRQKVKVSKWIDRQDLRQNEEFVRDWHNFKDDLVTEIRLKSDECIQKKISLYLLQQFYLRPYNVEVDFYEQFNIRLHDAVINLGLNNNT